MNRLSALLTAALFALTLLPGVPVCAADLPDVSGAIWAVPEYPLDRVDGTLYIVAANALTYRLEVIQHSPERENLVLYNCSFPLEAGEAVSYQLEAGDYTLRTSVAATSDGLAPQTYVCELTVDNADMYDFGTSEIYQILTREVGEDYEWAEPTRYYRSTGTQNGKWLDRSEITFTAYDRLRGDYDGDGNITITDARNVLDIHVRTLSALSSYYSNAQLAACDFNGNDALDLEDAKTILNYVVSRLAFAPEEWPS